MLRIKFSLTRKIEISSVDPLELLGTNDQNIKLLDISTDDGDLEDVFIRLTKN